MTCHDFLYHWSVFEVFFFCFDIDLVKAKRARVDTLKRETGFSVELSSFWVELLHANRKIIHNISMNSRCRQYLKCCNVVVFTLVFFFFFSSFVRIPFDMCNVNDCTTTYKSTAQQTFERTVYYLDWICVCIGMQTSGKSGETHMFSVDNIIRRRFDCRIIYSYKYHLNMNRNGFETWK